MTLAMPEELAVGLAEAAQRRRRRPCQQPRVRSRPVGLCRDDARARRGRHPMVRPGRCAGAARPRRRRADRHRHQRLAAYRPVDAGAARPAGAARRRQAGRRLRPLGHANTSPSRRSGKGARRPDAAALGLGDHRRASACRERRRRRRSPAATWRKSIRWEISCSTSRRRARQACWSRCGSSRRARSSCATIPLPNFFDMGRD